MSVAPANEPDAAQPARTMAPYDKPIALLDAIIADAKVGALLPTGQTTSAAPAKKPAKNPPKPPASTAAKPAVAKAKAAAAPQAQAAAAKAAAAPAPAPAPAASSPHPATTALYQQDTYLFESEATVLAVEELPDGKGFSVILDATCFHPQGGGQPADVGTITPAGGGAGFAVAMVRKGPTGVVAHEGAEKPPAGVAAGARVSLAVDGAKRVFNARVHSAGHLIDVAMTRSGMAEKLRPTKGYHFTPGAYVEYDGKLDAKEREALLPALQAAMDTLIGEGIPTVVKDVDAQALDTCCPPNALPADRALWGTGWVRVVSVGDQGCPCGGTHVRDTAELGKVEVTGIKVKGKVTRVSYTMAQPLCAYGEAE